MRETQQRDAIRDALKMAERPLSVDEILKLAQTKVSGIGIATVYRNLKGLQADGIITQVDLPGQPPRWELAPASHHHHFLCRTCDRLFEVPGCPVDIDEGLPDGYIVEGHEVLFHGQCNTCAKRVGNSKR
jgi:Fur family transcriptional regulator, ferric uptake regulator